MSGWKIRISTPKINIGSKPLGGLSRSARPLIAAPKQLLSKSTISGLKSTISSMRSAIAIAAPASLLATAQTVAVAKAPLSGKNVVGAVLDAPGKGAYDAARFAGASKNTADTASKAIVGGELVAGALIVAPSTTTALIHSTGAQVATAVKSTATATVLAAAKKTIGGGSQPAIPAKAATSSGGVALAGSQHRTFVQWLDLHFPSSHAFSKIFGG